MKTLFTILLFITSAIGSYAQNPKIMAETVRSSESIVKGAPFSAEAVTESVQILADGNRIVRRSISRMYRDSEGRFRREDMPKQIGLPGANVEMPASILILDPSIGFRYQLNTDKNTARQYVFKQTHEKLRSEIEFKLKKQAKELEKASNELEKDAKELEKEAKEARERKEGKEATEAKQAVLKAKRAEMTAERAKRNEERKKRISEKRVELEKRLREKANERVNIVRPSHDANTKTESLGVKDIGGVSAEGTRNTTTIPAGSIGNERPIEVVYERWYSKELQLVVSSKHSDPRFGEQTYELNNIRREEPQSSLFAPPANYTIIEDKRAPKSPPVKKVAAIPGKPAPPPAPVIRKPSS